MDVFTEAIDAIDRCAGMPAADIANELDSEGLLAPQPQIIRDADTLARIEGPEPNTLLMQAADGVDYRVHTAREWATGRGGDNPYPLVVIAGDPFMSRAHANLRKEQA